MKSSPTHDYRRGTPDRGEQEDDCRNDRVVSRKRTVPNQNASENDPRDNTNACAHDKSAKNSGVDAAYVRQPAKKTRKRNADKGHDPGSVKPSIKEIYSTRKIAP